MTKFWLSWYHSESHGGFELHSPWWTSGMRVAMVDERPAASDGDAAICAAVVAVDEEAAKEAVLASYDRRPDALEWRFCEPKTPDWTPFSGRFQQAGWMRWPPEPTALPVSAV